MTVTTDTSTEQEPVVADCGDATDQEPDRSSRWFTMLSGLVVLAVGVALGWLIFSSPGTDGPALAPAPTAASESDSAPSEADPSGEPVADVAESLLPSVVQIQIRGGAIGSGVIYDSEGLILTAAHVVDGADQVQLLLSDGSRHTGDVVGSDIESDIAVIRIDGGTDLPAAPLAVDDEIRVGELAVAIGSPFGLDSTVTSGVVSALNQAVSGPNRSFQSLIQTDAAINPGNSGGALANRQGEVIGINVSIFSASGGNDGIGFAVPIDRAADLAEAIVSGETLSTAVLGVTGTPARTGESGALITDVAPRSGAAEAGIEPGDVILGIDGVRVSGIRDLAAQVQAHRPGDEVTVEVLRDDEAMNVTVVLGSS